MTASRSRHLDTPADTPFIDGEPIPRIRRAGDSGDPAVLATTHTDAFTTRPTDQLAAGTAAMA